MVQQGCTRPLRYEGPCLRTSVFGLIKTNIQPEEHGHCAREHNELTPSAELFRQKLYTTIVTRVERLRQIRHQSGTRCSGTYIAVLGRFSKMPAGSVVSALFEIPLMGQTAVDHPCLLLREHSLRDILATGATRWALVEWSYSCPNRLNPFSTVSGVMGAKHYKLQSKTFAALENTIGITRTHVLTASDTY